MPAALTRDPLYRGYRFHAEIISHAVWLYYRFALSHRDIEDLLAERGVQVSYEAIRLWCRKFGSACAAGLRRRRRPAAGKWHVDEVQLKIKGKKHWLWRAVDSDGLVLDILVQERRNQEAAERFLRRVLDGGGTVTAGGGHGQVRELPARTAAGAPGRGAPAAQGAQQPGGELAPTRAQARTRAPALQVAGARAALPGALQRPLQPLSPPAPAPFSRALPPDPHRALRAVAGGGEARVRQARARHLSAPSAE